MAQDRHGQRIPHQDQIRPRLINDHPTHIIPSRQRHNGPALELILHQLLN